MHAGRPVVVTAADSGPAAVALARENAVMHGDFHTAAAYVDVAECPIIEALGLGVHSGGLTGSVSVGTKSTVSDSATMVFVGRMCRQAVAVKAPVAAPDYVRNSSATILSDWFVVHL